MNEDPAVGRFLESLAQAGGYLQTLVPIDGLSPEAAYAAAQRTVMLGYATTPARTGANGLPSTLFDVRITSAGKDHLQQHRRTSPHLIDPTARPGEGLHSSLEARTARRIQFIKAVYEDSNGSEANVTDGFDLGSRLGWPYRETNDIMQYWEAEHLIKFVAEEGAIVITHRGIVELEGARDNPYRRTQHFPPFSVVIHGDVTNSPMQIGTIDSTQTVFSQVGMDAELVLAFLDAVQAATVQSPVPGTSGADVGEMIEQVRSQLERPEPNRSMVKATVGALREIALGMAAIGGWELAVELAHKLGGA
ncbi:MAG: hypothetical protein ACRDYB_00110 [Acidimicrobiales bacterium]